jgi:hypothetical protein
MKKTLLTTAAIAFAVLTSLQLPKGAYAEDAAPIKSTRSHGVIVLAPEKSLTDGRLVMRVVAYNGGNDPVQLTAASIHVATTAGAAVALLSLEQLVKEVQDSKKAKATRTPAAGEVLPGKFGRDTGSAMRDSTGNVVKGVNGGVNTSVGDQVPYAIPRETAPAKETKESAAAAQQQIAELKTGILQTLTIQPRAAAGAQIVTDKLKFEPSEERVLHVTVDFNGEQHELRVPVPDES